MIPPISPPTLEDVAKRAGVSTATVSRCLNAPDKVVEKTRERVMEAVAALGYTPNFAARVMAAKRTFTIGAIIPTMENAIFAKGLQAFQEELQVGGYTLLVASSAYRPELEMEQIRSLVARGADGLLLIGYERADEVYAYLERQNVPALAAWTYRETAPIPSVGFDNRAAMQAVAEVVLAQGHTRLAVISGIREGNDRVQDRIAGVRAALSAHGLNAGALPVVETVYDFESGARAMRQLMEVAHRPTAVLCVNDVLAVGALYAARDLGFDVPGDVSITGFDDIELAEIVRPALTTVHVPHRRMGREAAKALIAMVERKGDVASVALETSICARATLGPVPRA